MSHPIAVRSLLVAWFVFAATAAAKADGTAQLVVTVTANGRAVSQGVCRLTNPVVRRQVRTDGDGRSIFDGLDPGAYHVECNGPDALRGATEVRIGEEATKVSLAIVLQAVRIGETRSAPPRVSAGAPVVVSRNAPLGRLSGSLYDALDRLGGAQVVVGANGELTGISLEGKDPRLTQYAFDGARLSDPAAIRAIPDDVLQSIAVDDGRGQVDLYTLAPTAYPEYWARQRIGGFGNGALQFGARGAIGSAGFVVQASQSDARSPLDGSRYTDLSGLDYVHEGWARGANLLAKVAVPVGPSFTVTVESLRGDRASRPIDATILADVPSGTGPGAWTAGRSAVDRIEIEGDADRWHLRGDAGFYGTHDLTDDATRVLALQNIPLTVAAEFGLATADVSAVDSIGDGKTLNAGLSGSRSRTTVNTLVGGAESAFTDDGIVVSSDVRARASYVLKRGPFDTTTLTLQEESRGAGAAGAYVDASGTYGSAAKRVFARVGAGTRPVAPGAPASFSDPAAAQYDCAGDRIIVSGPNERAAPVAETHVSLGASADSRNGSFSAQVYRTTDQGLALSNALGLFGAYGGTLPPQYEALLVGGYQQFGGCIAGPAPQIFVQHDVGGLSVEYRGADVLGAWRPNARLTLQGGLHVHQALLRREPLELTGSDTPYVLGRQLPGVPPLDTTLTVDWGFGDRKTELIGNAAYTPLDNVNHLPAYCIVTLGGTRRLSATTSVTVVAANVTRQDVGLFSSTARAVALPTASGLPLLLPATPLMQPQIFVIVESRVSRQP